LCVCVDDVDDSVTEAVARSENGLGRFIRPAGVPGAAP